jgi:hypothetical protein
MITDCPPAEFGIAPKDRREKITQVYFDALDKRLHYELTECMYQFTGTAAAHTAYHTVSLLEEHRVAIRMADEAAFRVQPGSATIMTETTVLFRRANVVIELIFDSRGKPLLSLGQVEKLAAVIAQRLR